MDEQKPPNRNKACFLVDPVPPTQRAGLDGNLAMLHPMPKTLQEAAKSQDLIGWDKFLHGKVSIKIRKIQEAHCIIAGTRINGPDWMAQFVCQLVGISHAQWLYRNFTLHHYAKGYIRLQTEQDIRKEVDLLMDTRPSDLPTKCHYLLELPQIPSTTSSAIHDVYWVLALKTAKTVTSRDEREYAQKGTRVQRREPKASKNLLNGVVESLCRHLQIDLPRGKRKQGTEMPSNRLRQGSPVQTLHEHDGVTKASKKTRQENKS